MLDLLDVVPMDFDPGVFKVTVPGQDKPFYTPVVREMSLRNILQDAADDFGVELKDVSFESTDIACDELNQDVFYGIWCDGGPDKSSWLAVNIVYDDSDDEPIDYDEDGDLSNMVWADKANAKQYAKDNKTPGVKFIVKPYVEQ